MIAINLHPHEQCREYRAWHEYLSDPKPSAVIELPITYGPIERQWSSTARNRLRYSQKMHYSSREITWTERTNYLDDIHAINISKSIRQGKPIAESYLAYPKYITGRKTCDEHYSTFIGCFKDGKLYAYIATNFCGDLVAASQIMGHGDFLNDGIMLNLWHEFVKVCIERKIKLIIYSRWDDGFDGLRFWKKSVGMKPETLKEIIV